MVSLLFVVHSRRRPLSVMLGHIGMCVPVTTACVRVPPCGAESSVQQSRTYTGGVMVATVMGCGALATGGVIVAAMMGCAIA